MPHAYKTKPLTAPTLTRLEDGELWTLSAELSFQVIVGSGPAAKELRVVGTVVAEVELQAGERWAHFTLVDCEVEASDIEDFEFLCADALRGDLPGFEWEALSDEDRVILASKAEADREALLHATEVAA